ncbi:VPS33 [Candida oxycetoniae]|uniref:VPS33 n=1 Tax=Candida oxycetoniae TaxID=497107 RepID=A0AAI9SYU4_9ASCO|nr:VPS33 [Candida oxycetoniae]KAI3405728.2 VPS33 [Candida oxycetoniae]
MTEEDSQPDWGRFNEGTLSNLLDQLDRIYSSNNLLVLDPVLSPLLNRLTSFSVIKEHGKCQNVTWLDDESVVIPANVLSKYSSLVLLISESIENLAKVKKCIHAIQKNVHALKYYVIVKGLTRSFLYQINQAFDGINEFDKILSLPDLSKPIAITSKIKIFRWANEPIYTDGTFITDSGYLAGIDDYFEKPLRQNNQLTDALVKLLFMGIHHGEKHRHLFKLRNVYGKGNNSELLINMLMKSKIPSFLNEHMSQTEIEFYKDKLHSNTDLVVLERNLDFFPVLFNQLNYHGIVDDMFGINFENIVKIDKEVSKDLSRDELYNQDLKHLNFSTVGARLNKLAKYIKQRFEDTGHKNDPNISEMKNLVATLGTLSVQQDLIKKHTIIGESIVGMVEGEYERFLAFQNDIFEMDYKLQISKLKSFINGNYPIENLWTILLLIGYTNDGILNKDIEKISMEMQDNYGLEAALSLQKLIHLKLIRVINDSSNDFFTSLGLTSQKKKIAVQQSSEEDDGDMGISGGKDVFKSNYTLINKFWNLHPLQEDEFDTKESTFEASESKQESTSLMNLYPTPSFTLPGNTVPLIYRLVESLYFRDFLKYKPTNNIKRRPNWDNLGLNAMFAGKMVDMDLENANDDKSKYLIIVVIGGITRSELTCLKYLEERFKRKGTPKEIIVLTSGIINHHKLWRYLDQ